MTQRFSFWVTLIVALLLHGCSLNPSSPLPSESTPQAASCPDPIATQCPTLDTLLDGKIIIGEAEPIRVTPPGLVLAARIDTGATTTSIDAREIQRFERDGKRWVSFVLLDAKGQPNALERPLKRMVQIKRHGGDSLERPVVSLKLELAGKRLNTEVSLTDRSSFEYPLLIGRNFLKDIYIVDVSRKLSHKPMAEAKP